MNNSTKGLVGRAKQVMYADKFVEDLTAQEKNQQNVIKALSAIVEGKAVEEKGLPMLLTLLSELQEQHAKAIEWAVKFDVASPNTKRHRKA